MTEGLVESYKATTMSPTKISTQNPTPSLSQLLLINMQFFMFTTVVAASVAVAIAAPLSAGGADGAGAPSVNSAVCSNTAVCCTTDLSGVVDLDCSPREFSLRL